MCSQYADLLACQAVDPNLFYDSNNYADHGDDDVEEIEQDEETARQFLAANKQQSLSLADIILAKLREKEEMQIGQPSAGQEAEEGSITAQDALPPKVIEVYTAVGQLLQHYRSGKIPKALKMLPNLRGWERILWVTRPDLWSPAATYAVTRIFSSNLQVDLTCNFLSLQESNS